jgi:hypothetical protein
MKKISKVGLTLATASLVAMGTFGAAHAAFGATPNVPDGKAAVPAVVTTPPRMFAVVNSNGTLNHGKAVASVTRLSTGTYDVRFTRTSIASCAWTGTVGLGGFSGSTGPGEITITGRAGTTNGLFVTTFNGTGVATDEPFAAVVICA